MVLKRNLKFVLPYLGKVSLKNKIKENYRKRFTT